MMIPVPTPKTVVPETSFGAINFLTNRYSVRLANNSTEVEQALKLRYEVFNVEMGAGYSHSHLEALDRDEFDRHCHHLVVIENRTNKVVGTYRLQDVHTAEQGKGFYSATEFAIHLFPSQVLLNSIELSRACIKKEHRNSRVLYLLWKGIARFSELSGMRYLFGSCSLPLATAQQAWSAFQYLKEGNYLHPQIHIMPTPGYKCIKPEQAHTTPQKVVLPQLFELYLKLGAKVCGPPAMDPYFNTIDFLILLDLDQLSEQTKSLFFR